MVSPESLERELTRVRAAAAGGVQGVFGPRSLTWQIDRESAIFFGAGRALLLQLAHPWVAAAIEQHSNAFADPVGRFHRTFSTVFAMVFGTLDQSMDAARRLHHRHASIIGQLPWTAGPFAVGSTYRANAIPALRWVYATLIETALVAYELVLPPLTAQQRDRYYRESQLALTRRLYPLLPARLRYVGPFQEADERLAGRPAPAFVTRLCNRFWIGQAEL